MRNIDKAYELEQRNKSKLTKAEIYTRKCPSDYGIGKIFPETEIKDEETHETKIVVCKELQRDCLIDCWHKEYNESAVFTIGSKT